jgi:hypothetical protein
VLTAPAAAGLIVLGKAADRMGKLIKQPVVAKFGFVEPGRKE